MLFLKTVLIYFIVWLPEAENPTVLAAILKCLPILCLCGFIWFQSIDPTTQLHSYSAKILYGLVFSCLGDIFIVWEYTHFEYGIVAFAIAHLFYVSALGLKPLNLKLGLALLILNSFVYFLFLPALRGFLVTAVAVYMFVIMLMIWRALSGVQSDVSKEGDSGQWRKQSACLGALLFATSDLILGLNKFSLPIPFARALIMMGYYGGQLGIALSAFSIENELSKKGKET